MADRIRRSTFAEQAGGGLVTLSKKIASRSSDKHFIPVADGAHTRDCARALKVLMSPGGSGYPLASGLSGIVEVAGEWRGAVNEYSLGRAHAEWRHTPYIGRLRMCQRCSRPLADHEINEHTGRGETPNCKRGFENLNECYCWFDPAVCQYPHLYDMKPRERALKVAHYNLETPDDNGFIDWFRSADAHGHWAKVIANGQVTEAFVDGMREADGEGLPALLAAVAVAGRATPAEFRLAALDESEAFLLDTFKDLSEQLRYLRREFEHSARMDKFGSGLFAREQFMDWFVLYASEDDILEMTRFGNLFGDLRSFPDTDSGFVSGGISGLRSNLVVKALCHARGNGPRTASTLADSALVELVGSPWMEVAREAGWALEERLPAQLSRSVEASREWSDKRWGVDGVAAVTPSLGAALNGGSGSEFGRGRSVEDQPTIASKRLVEALGRFRAMEERANGDATRFLRIWMSEPENRNRYYT